MTRCHGPVTTGLVLLLLALTGATVPQTESQSPEKAATRLIRQTLDSQVAAWNRGDLAGFMDGYVRGEELRFASGGTIQNGWQKTLERYQSKYSSRELMGTLKFSDLQILVLSDGFAEVFGRYQLTRARSVGDSTGLFTLLMQRDGDRWLVLHDHTSSSE